MNKKQIKFLKYVSRPRSVDKVKRKFPKCEENFCLYTVDFSKYFMLRSDKTYLINDNGRDILRARRSKISAAVAAAIGAVCALYAPLKDLLPPMFERIIKFLSDKIF